MLRPGSCVALLFGGIVALGCAESRTQRQVEPGVAAERRESSKQGPQAIEGVVRDELGRPQPRVSVCAYAPTSDTGVRGAPSATTWTDDAGRFVIAGLSPGRWRLGSPPEIATDLPCIDELDVDAGSANVTLVLRPGLQRR